MSHTNEMGMVVGKRYMLTYKYGQTKEIAILKYSEFTGNGGGDTDKYDVEYLLNTKTGGLRRNFKYETRVNVRYFIDIIDMEEIEKEIEMDAVRDKPELYFKACREIYNRLTGERNLEGGGKKIKSKKGKRRKSKKKKKSKTRRRRR